MNQNSNCPPVARLIGVTENSGEGCACSLVFELESASGQRLTLTYGNVMEALRFAQQQSVMAPLSEHWWARVEKYDGCTF
ncbi:hypothetical protein [Pseudomonas cerasi]|uniref:Uncharacterized protein n=1 Tax=Pseudomonas cerasi TaxID=1583341 RepID=A0A193SGP0_9PSED|nr:hypothetical protein [Pseudomonas cerasi]CZT26106.1 hypothetical protein PCPL58_p3012 [Pseudomonas cerasi]CZT26180.1 hypothetical protein PCPL58_p3086 [Pseudomonas cerasi]SOS30255.1 hypothetical protein PL963_P200132 [Pseudomonas cerasi]